MITLTGTHNWVKHTVTEVEVLSDPEGEGAVVALSSLEQIEKGEATAVFGCSRCNLPLNATTSEQACHGE